MFKFIAVRRVEKAKKIDAIRAEIERKEIEVKKERKEKERKEKEYKEALEKAKKLAPDLLLTISADNYVKKAGKKLLDYECKSVDGESFYGYSGSSGLEKAISEAKKEMIDKMKKLGAEIIIDVKPSISYSDGYKIAYFIGTALIPKKK